MNERTPSPAEKFPTEGEVMRVMERLFEGARFTEIERTERDGVLRCLVFEGVDSEGDRLLYEYYVEEHGAKNVSIRVTFHDKEGVPCGGHNVANFVDGFWKIDE